VFNVNSICQLSGVTSNKGDRYVRIAVDWDNVVVNTGKIKAEMAKRLFKIDVDPGFFKAEYVVDRDRLLTFEEYRKLTRLVSGPELGYLVEPMERAVETIRVLQEERHDLCVVTSRNGKFLRVARNIALQNGLSLDFRGTGYGKSKAPALHGWDIFMDDDPEKLADLDGIVPHRFLFSHPYNLRYALPPGIIRVSSWRMFYDRIHAVRQPHFKQSA